MQFFFRTIHSLLRGIISFLKGLGTKRKWVAIVIGVLIIAGVGYSFFGPQPSADDSVVPDEIRTVELIPVVDHAEDVGNSVNTAGSETVVRSETAGKVVQVVPAGTRVSSGTTLALFENAAQQASLLQAEGTLEAAKASLEKTQKGLRSEKLAVLETAFESSESGAVTALLSAYGAIDSAVRNTADQVFSNPESQAPRLNFSSSNNQRRNDLENERVLLNLILDRQSVISLDLSVESDLEEELTVTEEELRQVRTFIDTLISALNEAIPTGSITTADIAGHKTAATTARTALTTALSSISGARASFETAQKNLEEGITGAEDTDLAGAAAAVKQAQGAYDIAFAAYRKTIVRAPASGTVVSCSAATGDVIAVGSDVCRIKTITGISRDTFILPLSSVKYTPAGAFVFVVSADRTLEPIEVVTGLVTASGINVTGLLGDEHVVKDVRGLKAGETVNLN